MVQCMTTRLRLDGDGRLYRKTSGRATVPADIPTVEAGFRRRVRDVLIHPCGYFFSFTTIDTQIGS